MPSKPRMSDQGQTHEPLFLFKQNVVYYEQWFICHVIFDDVCLALIRHSRFTGHLIRETVLKTNWNNAQKYRGSVQRLGVCSSTAKLTDVELIMLIARLSRNQTTGRAEVNVAFQRKYLIWFPISKADVVIKWAQVSFSAMACEDIHQSIDDEHGCTIRGPMRDLPPMKC